MRLSKHFVENWALRVGGEVSPEAVERVMAESILVQPARDFRIAHGQRYRRLAIYWNPDRDLILKVDHAREVAVTVLSPMCRRGRARTQANPR